VAPGVEAMKNELDKPKNSGRFGKGNPGKPKGAVSKVPKELKDMILQALGNAGGVDYLTERAQDPRTASAFLTLVGKTLPMTVKGPGEGGAHVFQKIVVEIVKAKD
jgi:hypothetical protein